MKLKLLLGVALLALMGAAFGAPAEPTKKGPPSLDGCTKEHSRALCIAKAGFIAGDMRDLTPGELSAPVKAGDGSGLWYAGAIAADATKLFSPPKGFSRGGSIGMLILGAITEKRDSEPDLVGRNLIVGFMPESMASDKDDAVAKARAIVLEATMKVFAGYTVVEQPMPDSPEHKMYQVTGGACEGHTCLLVTPLAFGGRGWLLGGRAFKTTAPDFLGGGSVYRFGSRSGALYPLTLMVDGKHRTHEYLQELSKHLPEWMHVVASMEQKRSGGGLFNEGMAMPVAFSQGEALMFVHPDPTAAAAVAAAQ